MKKRLSILVIVLVITAIMTSCDKATEGVEAVTSKVVLEELCSKEYEGRLIGTDGNTKAQKFLESYMKKIGIEPYLENNYNVSYSQKTSNPNKQNTKITITFKDNSTMKLTHGKDFFTNAATKPIDVTIPITDAEQDSVDGGVLRAVEKFTLVVGSPDKTYGKFTATIPLKLKNELIKKGAVSAKITSDFVPEESNLSNIVGVIKGNGGTKKAVVLTAHFDHVGKQGEFLFNGVLDNASGVAGLMSTALKLKDLTADRKPDYDIVIAAVNSEDTNEGTTVFPGSSALVEELKKSYEKLVNINIDCIGNGKELFMGQTASQNYDLSDKFKSALSTAGIAFNDKIYGSSDSISFTDNNYPAITVGTIDTGEFEMHSADMKTTDINIDEIENLSNLIAEFVVNTDLFAPVALNNASEVEEGSDEWFDLIYKESAAQNGGKPLRLNQQIHINLDGRIVLAGAKPTLNSYDEFEKYFPDVKLPKTVLDYTFSEVRVGSSDVVGYGIVNKSYMPKGVKVNQVVDVELAPENIYRLNVRYKKGNSIIEIRASTTKADPIADTDYQDVVKLDLKGYEQLKLVSHEKAEGFYFIAKELEDLTLKFYFIDATTDKMLEFSKEEMIKKIDELRLTEKIEIYVQKK